MLTFETIPHSPDGDDARWLGRIGFDLLSNPTDMYINSTAATAEIPPPDFFKD